MKRLDIEAVKKIQLEILSVVDAFCKENRIQYWLDSGTLLGAIRHRGYIPWDDDVDIGMLRDDFDAFIATFNARNSRYQVICNEVQKDCYYPYAKVIDTHTVLYEPDENGLKLSVNIDIFVYDATPGGKKAEKQYDRRDLFAKLNVLQFLYYPSKKRFKKMLRILIYHGLKLFPKGYFSSRIVRNSKKYAKTDAHMVGNFTSATRILCDKSVFDSFVLKEFEGKEYPVPVGYDAWLTAFYGDYMQLPPLEKRVTHHQFKAYINDEKD